jgi:uncharacterized protein YqjF (DUF2071 family)
MNTTPAGVDRECAPNDAARHRLLSMAGEPLFFSDWLRAVFIHYEIDPKILQPHIPFPLDLYHGKAYISVVAFTMQDLRPRLGGRLGAMLFRPIATHGLLNIRTYVRYQGETGIYFIAEWIPNRLSAWLGPRTFGLPYLLGNLQYHHQHEQGNVSGTVTAGPIQLAYQAEISCRAPLQECEPGSVDDFLLERYTAFTCIGSKQRFFRIWHAPWRQTSIPGSILHDSLLMDTWPWFKAAKYFSSHYSPGVENVCMGRPQLVARLRKR